MFLGWRGKYFNFPFLLTYLNKSMTKQQISESEIDNEERLGNPSNLKTKHNWHVITINNQWALMKMFLRNDLKRSVSRTSTSKYFNSRWNWQGETRWTILSSQSGENPSSSLNFSNGLPVQARSVMLELSSSFYFGEGLKNQKVQLEYYHAHNKWEFPF